MAPTGLQVLGQMIGIIQKIRSFFTTAARDPRIQDLDDKAGVLETMLIDCQESPNPRLMANLQKHHIPERLAKLSEVISRRHRHPWGNFESRNRMYTFVECILEESQWNTWGLHAWLMLGNTQPSEAAGGLSESWGPQVHAHIRENQEQFELVARETKALFTLTMGLITSANASRR